MSGTVSVIFKGELQAGFALEEVKAHATEAFKLNAEKCAQLFGGQPVLLRKGLPISELPRYLERVHRIGMSVEVQAEQSSDAAPVAPPPAIVAAAGEMTCPQCGEVQPRRTLCRNCAADMPRIAAARQLAEQETRAAARAGRDEGTVLGDANYRELFDEQPAFFGLSFGGRISRTVYACSGMVGMAAFPLMGVGLLRGGFTPGLIAIVLILSLLLVVWSLRMTVLRLHDLGWSGWWSLLSLLPGVGQLIAFIMWLVLGFKAGEREANDWGEPGRRASMPVMVACGLVFLLASALLFKEILPLADNPEVLQQFVL